MKKLFIIVGLVLLAAVGFVAYIVLTLDPDELGQRVLGMVNERAGVELTAEKFQVRPLRGVRLENGHFEGELEAGSVTGSLDRMVLDYKLLPILKGEVVVHRILIESPSLEVVSRPAEAADSMGASATSEPAEGAEQVSQARGSGFVSSVSISEIRVTDGSLSITTEGSESVGLRVEGLELELGDLSLDSTAVSPFMGFSAKGGVRIEEIRLDEMAIRGGRGDLALDRGHLVVTNLGIETTHANLEVAEMAADMTQDPSPYRLQVGGSYDLNGLVEAEGDGFGAAALEFSAAGSGPSISDLEANGTFRLDSGEIPAFPMMVKIEKLLGKSVIVGFPYEGTDIVFSIADGKTVIEPFVMGFENLQMAGGGGIDLAGPIDMQIDIRLPRESVSSSILDPFIDGMTDGDGWTTIPFNISGTMAEPDVVFDMTAVKQTAVDMGKRAVGEALDSAVEKMKERTLQRRPARSDKDDD